MKTAIQRSHKFWENWTTQKKKTKKHVQLTSEQMNYDTAQICQKPPGPCYSLVKKNKIHLLMWKELCDINTEVNKI